LAGGRIGFARGFTRGFGRGFGIGFAGGFARGLGSRASAFPFFVGTAPF